MFQQYSVKFQTIIPYISTYFQHRINSISNSQINISTNINIIQSVFQHDYEIFQHISTEHFNMFQHFSTCISTDLMNVLTFFIHLKGVEIMFEIVEIIIGRRLGGARRVRRSWRVRGSCRVRLFFAFAGRRVARRIKLRLFPIKR